MGSAWSCLVGVVGQAGRRRSLLVKFARVASDLTLNLACNLLFPPRTFSSLVGGRNSSKSATTNQFGDPTQMNKENDSGSRECVPPLYLTGSITYTMCDFSSAHQRERERESVRPAHQHASAARACWWTSQSRVLYTPKHLNGLLTGPTFAPAHP